MLGYFGYFQIFLNFSRNSLCLGLAHSASSTFVDCGFMASGFQNICRTILVFFLNLGCTCWFTTGPCSCCYRVQKKLLRTGYSVPLDRGKESQVHMNEEYFLGQGFGTY